MSYCCAMRLKFIIGILAEAKEVPDPVDIIDYLDFNVKTPDGRPVIRIKYCPFCGKQAIGPLRAL